MSGGSWSKGSGAQGWRLERGFGRGQELSAEPWVEVFDGKRGLMVTEDRLGEGLPSRALGQGSQEEARGAGFSTLG